MEIPDLGVSSTAHELCGNVLQLGNLARYLQWLSKGSSLRDGIRNLSCQIASHIIAGKRNGGCQQIPDGGIEDHR